MCSTEKKKLPPGEQGNCDVDIALGFTYAPWAASSFHDVEFCVQGAQQHSFGRAAQDSGKHPHDEVARARFRQDTPYTRGLRWHQVGRTEFS